MGKDISYDLSLSDRNWNLGQVWKQLRHGRGLKNFMVHMMLLSAL